jgi:hypothetical protein
MAMGGTLTAMDDAERAFEAALCDATYQPYGQIMIMAADGGNKRLLTDSLWEDSMPLYIPAKLL